MTRTGHGNLSVNDKMGYIVLGTTGKEKGFGVTISADMKGIQPRTRTQTPNTDAVNISRSQLCDVNDLGHICGMTEHHSLCINASEVMSQLDECRTR